MSRQGRLYLALAIASLLMLTVSPLEYISYKFMSTASFIALAGLISIVVACVLAFRNFHREESPANIANLFFIAALPIALGVVLTLIHKEPNVHGISLPAFLLYTAISEICALALLIALIIRAIRN
ncbi:hypothetical protein [Acidicapsa ligni]|uniref:hypothetical protein n=1 Tax=Acidicapsa ligni TaxID=542300 RepID=UPI0021DF46C6|nr:hypothetical protein [Acidicapsa ligni]